MEELGVNTATVISPSATGHPPAPVSELAAANPIPRPHLTIRPSRGWTAVNLAEIWQFRDLLVTLASRDLKLRYKQTALGVIWVVVQPLLAAGVLSFVFGGVAKLPPPKLANGMEAPYFVLSFAGLLGWTYFSGVLTKISGCLVGNSHLISKVFFPRLVLPLSTIGSSLVDLGVSAAMMALLLLIAHIVPSASLVLLPLWILVLTAIALGVGLITAALMVSYRDIGYILPFAVQILMYASPVAYSIENVPAKLRWIYTINPLSPPLEAIRASLLGTAMPSAGALLVSVIVAAATLVVGLYSFKHMERSFADVI